MERGRTILTANKDNIHKAFLAFFFMVILFHFVLMFIAGYSTSRLKEKYLRYNRYILH